MKELTKENLKEINGGAISVGWLAFVPFGVSFLIGLIDGYIRPLKCN